MVPTSGMDFPANLGHDRKTAHIGCLALIGGHAQGGIAFEMFDRAEALLMAQFDVFDRHIVLLVQPRPRRAFTYQNGVLTWRVLGSGDVYALMPMLVQRPRAERLCKAACVLKSPFAAPATVMPGGRCRRDKGCKSPFQVGRPRWWQVMWTLGFHPPETPKRTTSA